MNAVVVYESVYANTRRIAEAVAEGLGGARVLSVDEAAGQLGDPEVLVVGGPTHVRHAAGSVALAHRRCLPRDRQAAA